MKQTTLKIEITMVVYTDDSATLDEVTDIALFECGASSGIKTGVMDKMQDSLIHYYEVLDVDFN